MEPSVIRHQVRPLPSGSVSCADASPLGDPPDGRAKGRERAVAGTRRRDTESRRIGEESAGARPCTGESPHTPSLSPERDVFPIRPMDRGAWLPWQYLAAVIEEHAAVCLTLGSVQDLENASNGILQLRGGLGHSTSLCIAVSVVGLGLYRGSELTNELPRLSPYASSHLVVHSPIPDPWERR